MGKVNENLQKRRDQWLHMINGAYALDFDERLLLENLDQEIIDIALKSRSSIAFINKLSEAYPDINPDELPETYKIVGRILNEMKKNRKTMRGL